MEPVNVSSNAQLTLTAAEQTDSANHASDTAEQSSESFLATIVRLDQTSAEQLFRTARL